MFVSRTSQKLNTFLPALPEHYRVLSRMCINPQRHAIPIAADFVRFSKSVSLRILAPAQMVALYRCRVCKQLEAVGRHFSTGHPKHLATIR